MHLPRPTHARLRLDQLEDRTTPATFTVTSLADSGAGSLRAAITQANVADDADTIVFATAVAGGKVFLTTFSNPGTSTVAVPQPAGPSALVITNPVTIQGTGETLVRFGSAEFRLFQVTAAGRLTLRNLTLENGLARGGAGGAAGMGGAVYNQGSLTLDGCLAIFNQAIGAAGTSSSGGGGLGGPGNFLDGGGPNGGPGGTNGSSGGMFGGTGTSGGAGGFGGGGGRGGSGGTGTVLNGFGGNGGAGGFGGGGGSGGVGAVGTTGGSGGAGGFGGAAGQA